MMTEGYHSDLQVMLDAVEIHSPTQYSLFGKPRDFSAASLSDGQSGADGPVFMKFLENELYSQLYTRPTLVGLPSDALAQRDHISALSAANHGVGTWEPGWKIVSIDKDDGRVAVMRDQVIFWTPPTGLRTITGKIQPGAFCRVWVGKELRHLMPGFYFAIGNGNQRDNRDAQSPLVRFYWNLKAETAAPYIALATERLNREGIPFRTKVLVDPAAYIRADGGVLYVERRHFRSIRGTIRSIHQDIRPGLRPETPMFTKPLAEGLGLAEDPNNGLSFGQSRCQIAARAFWYAFQYGLVDPSARLENLAQAFRDADLNPQLPFLDRGSRDIYVLSADFAAAPQVAQPVTSRQMKRAKKGQKVKA